MMCLMPVCVTAHIRISARWHLHPNCVLHCLFSPQLMAAMDRVCGGSGQGRVVSLLEGGYDTQPQTLGLATCVEAHVKALRNGGI
jgi:hypothetical protein